jgi:hypothetical protein
MNETSTNIKFTHSRFTRIVGWYLFVNGFVGLSYSIWSVFFNPQYSNKFTLGFNSVVIPCVSSLIGYFMIKRSQFALELSQVYFIAAIPIFGLGTWEYTFAHGLSIGYIFGTEVLSLGILSLGINVLPFVGLWLLSKHRNLSNTPTLT